MAQTFDQASPIPAHLAEAKPRRSNVKFFVGGAVVLGLVVLLAVQAVMTTGAYFLTVQEVLDAGPDMLNQRIRVNGAVVEGSDIWNPQEITLTFFIEDENGAQIPILFHGLRPDNFQRAASAIVEGELQAVR